MNKPMNKNLPGYRLRLLRIYLGKNQTEFAWELGISNSVLSRYEKNLRGPDTSFFSRLRDKTGVDLNWLLTGDGKMFTPTPRNLAPKIAVAAKLTDHIKEASKLLSELQKF